MNPTNSTPLDRKKLELSSHFVLGAQNLVHHPDLSLNQEGEGKLFDLHQMVVEDLEKLVNKKNLIERWIDRESANDYKYFAFYQKDSDDNIISIITGVIKDDVLTVINTATVDNLRRSGFMEHCIYSLVLDKNIEAIKSFDGCLNTEINKISQYQSTPLLQKNFKDNYQKILNLINQDIANNSLARVLEDDYSITRENPNEDQKKELFHANRLLQEIRSSNLWKKINFQVLKKISTVYSSSSKPSSDKFQFRFEIGVPSNNINLVPYLDNSRDLKVFVANKISKSQLDISR